MLDGWDPDDRLRLVQVRDFLAGQSWFDTTQYRLNPPDGGPMHWNRLIELPIVLIIWPLTPLMGAEWAERVAASFVPLVCLGLIMAMAGHIGKRLCMDAGHAKLANASAYAAAALTIGASPVLIQLLPMRIDHHGWQIVLAMLALLALGWDDRRNAGLICGGALALWLAISLEGLPLALGFFVVLGLGWLFDQNQGRRLFWSLAGFAVTQPLLYLATRGLQPAGGCDIIGPSHIGGAACASAILMIGVGVSHIRYRAGRPFSLVIKLIIAAIAVICGGTVFVLIAPQCATGAFTALDPLVREYWYLNVREGLPLWRQPLAQGLSYIAGPVLGLIAFLVLISQKPPAKGRQYLIESGILLIWSITIALFVFRAISVAAIFAVPFQAILAIILYHRARTIRQPVKRTLASLVIIPVIIPGAVIANTMRLAPSSNTDHQIMAEKRNSKCDNSDSLRNLSALPKGNIIAPFDLGPGILLSTEHNVLASSHHRNDKAMRSQIEIFRQPPIAAKRLIERHGIEYIVSCPNEAEMEIYARRHPEGLWNQLRSDDTRPQWLEPVVLDDSSLMIWKVRH